eukprot:3110131-Rhodomonas_salina.1
MRRSRRKARDEGSLGRAVLVEITEVIACMPHVLATCGVNGTRASPADVKRRHSCSHQHRRSGGDWAL